MTILAVLVIVALCEIGLRVSGWPRVIPYELGGEEYNAVAAALKRGNLPDVLVVGSSRAREALNLPLLKQLVSQEAGKEVTVGSCAVSGGLISDIDAIVSLALRSKDPPRLILYGVAERDINRMSPIYDQATRYWNFGDWRDASRIAGLYKTLPEIATVIRNEVGQYLRVLGEREQIRLTVRQRLAGTSIESGDTLIHGGLTEWQKSSPNRNMVNRPAPADEVQQNVRSFLRNEYPDPYLLKHFRQMLDRFNAGGTRLILFEVQPSRVIRRSLPKDIRPQFLDAVTTFVRDRPNVRFLSAEELNLGLIDRDFREMTHFNLSGATKMTKALVPLIKPSEIRLSPR